MRTWERLADVGGAVVAPAFRAGSRIRRSRSIHPVGAVYLGTVTAVDGPLREVGERLSGHVVARFSASLWKSERGWPDLLGCALRFCEPDRETDPDGQAQDLLFATVRRPWTFVPALVATRTGDFLANRFHAVSPFAVPGVGRARLRLVPHRDGRSTNAPSRFERLTEDVLDHHASLTLEVRRSGARSRFEPCADIVLVAPYPLDDDALRFNPFRTGRGLRPVGVIHHLRRSSYGASQRGHTSDAPAHAH